MYGRLQAAVAGWYIQAAQKACTCLHLHSLPNYSATAAHAFWLGAPVRLCVVMFTVQRSWHCRSIKDRLCDGWSAAHVKKRTGKSLFIDVECDEKPLDHKDICRPFHCEIQRRHPSRLLYQQPERTTTWASQESSVPCLLRCAALVPMLKVCSSPCCSWRCAASVPARIAGAFCWLACFESACQHL